MTLLTSRLLAAALAVSAVLPSAIPAHAAPLVRTQEGPVQGTARDGLHVFTRIPFAAPPVGALRFRPPQPAAKRSTTLVADQPIPNCIQFGGNNPAPQSEDCLYLSVWTPATASKGKPVPVMVWIFGSGLYTNGPQQYDGADLAREGVAVVTINHRLGLLGFLAHPSLDEAGNLSGNYGLRDVQAALRWVQKNIAGFGGDPANVTVFGESAGARLAMTQLISPPARGLFAKVIGESVGGMDSSGWRGGQVVDPRERVLEGVSRDVVKAVGCAGVSDVAACLRAAPVSAFVNSGLKPTATRLVTDPVLLPLEPNDAFKSGQFAHVPVLMGTGLNEGAFQIVPEEVALGRALHESDLPALYMKYFGEQAAAVAAGYPVARFGAPDLAIMSARTDIWQACPTDFLLRTIARHAPVYGYEFSATDLAQKWPGREITNIPNTPSHGSEIPYVFGGAHGVELSGRDAALSARFQRYWTNFARTGSPDPGGKEWPRFSAAHPAVLMLDDTPSVSLDYAERHNCTFMRDKGLVRY